MVGGCETSDTTICIVGNAFADSTISCIVDFYDDVREEFNLEKLQEENTPFVISIPLR